MAAFLLKGPRLHVLTSSIVLKRGNNESSHISQRALDDTFSFCRFTFMKSLTSEGNVNNLKAINVMDSTG